MGASADVATISSVKELTSLADSGLVVGDTVPLVPTAANKYPGS